MFPTEIELEMHRREMRRAAENHRLAQFVREEDAQPTLWQRLRTRLSTAQPVNAAQNQGLVQRQTEAIA